MQQMTVVNSSEHAERGVVVCTLRGMIVWSGPIDMLANAGMFDTIHCHIDDVDLAFHTQRPPSSTTLRNKSATLNKRLAHGTIETNDERVVVRAPRSSNRSASRRARPSDAPQE
jgi:hypothetical protein